MANEQAGQVIARVLQREGVSAVFTLCGGHVMAIYDGCLSHNIRVVDVRHEQAAAFAADAYSRISGRCGVAVVTAGPGVTNAFTAIANAARALSPMVVIGGAAATGLAGKGALQELDVLEAMRPFTKWAVRIPAAERIPEILSTAFRRAQGGIPGPVYVELPLDVCLGYVDTERLELPPPVPPRQAQPGDGALVAQAARLLLAARRPVAMVGSQVRWSPQFDVVGRWAERFGVPVFASGMARGVLPPGHPRSFARGRKQALRQADLVFVLGTPVDFRLDYGLSINPAADVVQVDLDHGQLGHNRPAAVALGADPGTVLKQMLELAGDQASPGQTEDWLATLAQAEAAGLAKLAPSLTAETAPVDPLRLCAEVDAFLAPDATIIGDGGDFIATAASVLRPRRYPAGWLDPGPLGTLGVGMGFAMAASVLRPGTQVCLMLGDGAAGLDLMEFEAAVRQNLPFVAVVGNDAGWTQIRRGQMQMFGESRAVATKLDYSRYDQVVTALGGHGEWVERPEEIRPALERAFASGKPALINVKLAPSDFRAGAISV